ncbi:hypothetical protein C8J56DRAFT_1029737 [Mycena floridula]|nr:hypothetical protein C8J56DRAFT_1029737 [Mycena floridula]
MTHYATKGTKNYLEKVAIVGAGGQVGSFIVDALLKTGKHEVTAITRVGSTSKLPTGVKVKKVNYDDASSLFAALQGQEALIITLGTTAPPEQNTKLIEAAAAANVPWVLPNAYAIDSTDTKLLTESLIAAPHVAIAKVAERDLVEKLGKSSWIAVTTSFWYEFSLSFGPAYYGFDLKNRTVTFFDEGTQKINHSTWPQIGLAVARLLSLKLLPDDADDKSPTLSQFRNKPLYISSFLLSQKDMLESILRVTGDEASSWKVEKQASDARWKEGQELIKKGEMLEGFGKMLYSRTFFPDGCGNYEAKLHNELLGLPKEDLDEFTKIAMKRAEGAS